MAQHDIQAQTEEFSGFATWLAGTLFLLWIGKSVGTMQKEFVNKALDSFTPRELPVQIPQTIASAGGELVAPRYRDLVGFISDPLPEYSVLTELLPETREKSGERKIDTVMKQLKSGVESIQQSENFRRLLITMSRFHEYSIGNQILIMLQKPDAVRVAGFTTWKELGRWVKKGEKGISILAPIFPPKPRCPVCNARIPKGARYCPDCGRYIETDGHVTPSSFRVVHIFDLSQTEGEPLPEIEVPTLTGMANEELFGKLLDLMQKQGVIVSFAPDPHMDPAVKGYYSVAGEIWVRPEEPRAQQLKTLIHEIAHYFTENAFHITRKDAETIAESAAYVVGAHYGFDTGVRSFPYVALWAEDQKVLEQNLDTIRKVSATILDELEKLSWPHRVNQLN